TILEYTAPRHLLRADFTGELARTIAAQAEQPFRDSFPNEDVTQLAMAATRTALETNSDQVDSHVDSQVDRWVRAIPTENTTTDASVLRARAKLLRGDAQGAAQELSRAADPDSNHNQVKYWLAIALQQQGALSDADSTLDEFLRKNPDSEPGLRNKADI